MLTPVNLGLIITHILELHLSRILSGTASHPDMQKIRINGFFFENKQHWRFEFRLLLFVLCTFVRSSRGLRRGSAAARLPRLWVWIPPRAWAFVCCECCLLSGRGLCDELITCPEESYRLWWVVVSDIETSWLERPWPNGRCCVKRKKGLFFVASKNSN